MPIIVRHRPYPHYAEYTRYKPHLRIDFSYICVYCGVHEKDWGGYRHFEVEHFRPKSRFPLLLCDYDNLLYACDVCNAYKGDDWPSDEPLKDGAGYLNPCEHDYDLHFAVEQSTGSIRGLTPPAVYMRERLHLDRQHLVRLRQKRFREEELHIECLQQTDKLLAMIADTLRDKSLSSQARILLTAFQKHLEADREDEVEYWRTRWQPPYEVHDLR